MVSFIYAGEEMMGKSFYILGDSNKKIGDITPKELNKIDIIFMVRAPLMGKQL
ncbi:hypothetical protein GCM10011391_01490 [Pullulanibacillus camelliae]|uniref:Uncharacterized protein n=1 Tax=Pullulanibacillus camelliae TaxID=1707096 RepID=A0A8J2VFY1_9BACL|nr:hypothetical protein [Pullulanibacillus camelliae]GGE26843.1 hypothetical protein GCM10011391_01490 [Pullulanibacillus camelliae]